MFRAVAIVGALAAGGGMLGMLASGADQTETGRQFLGVAFLVCAVCTVAAVLGGGKR